MIASKSVSTYFNRIGSDISACNGDLGCALQMAGLRFDVALETVTDARGKTIDRAFNVARQDDGESVGIVGARYAVTQTRDAFKYLDAMPGKANFRRGGMLKGGKYFLSAEFQSFDVKGDKLTAFGVFLGSFDGTWTNRQVLALRRESCTNIAHFMRGERFHAVAGKNNGIKAKHTLNHALKLDSFVFELAMAQADTEEEIGRMASRKISLAEYTRVVEAVIPGESTRAENTRAEIVAEFSNPARATYGETVFDAFNSFSAFDTHSAKRRETDTGTCDENAFEAFIAGKGTADKALPLLREVMAN